MNSKVVCIVLLATMSYNTSLPEPSKCKKYIETASVVCLNYALPQIARSVLDMSIKYVKYGSCSTKEFLGFSCLASVSYALYDVMQAIRGTTLNESYKPIVGNTATFISLLQIGLYYTTNYDLNRLITSVYR